MFKKRKMSSSDEEIIQQITVVKRRKRIHQPDETNSPIKLYSNKVMPTLRQTAIDSQKQIDEMKLESTQLKKKSDDNVKNIHAEEKENDIDSDGVEFVCEQPSISLTPPPVLQRTRTRKKRLTKLERTSNKLLSDIHLLKSKALLISKDVLNDSIDSSGGELCEVQVRTMMIKVRFKSNINRFLLDWNKPFFDVYNELAAKTKLNAQHIHLYLNDRKIEYSDTPEMLQLSVADIIEGFLLDNKKSITNKVDCIQLHFQCQFEKVKRSYNLNKYEPLINILEKYSSAIGHQLNNLIFQFDGDDLDIKLSPIELELEDEFCIDVKRKKTKSR